MIRSLTCFLYAHKLVNVLLPPHSKMSVPLAKMLRNTSGKGLCAMEDLYSPALICTVFPQTFWRFLSPVACHKWAALQESFVVLLCLESVIKLLLKWKQKSNRTLHLCLTAYCVNHDLAFKLNYWEAGTLFSKNVQKILRKLIWRNWFQHPL